MSAPPKDKVGPVMWRSLGTPLAVAAVMISAAIVLVATVQTSSARFAARTSNVGNLFTSAVISVDVESETPTDRQAELFLDGTGLYPGRSLENCLRIIDLSSVDSVDVRLFAPLIEGELGRFFELTISIAETVDGECTVLEDATPVFTGTLADFASQYDSFANGLRLAEPEPGVDVALAVTGGLIDDNEAQGLAVAYDILLEARPS